MKRLNIPAVIAGLEHEITQRSPRGELGRDATHALDVVYHALVFTGHPNGLRLWREALWNHHIDTEALRAIEQMLQHLDVEVAAGNADAISAVCDCLHTLFEPEHTASELRQLPPSTNSAGQVL
jgi:hypothetical protein